MPPLLFSSSSPKRVLFFVFFLLQRELPFNLLLFFKNKTIWCNQPNRIWTHHCKMQNEKPAYLLLLCFSLKLDLCGILPQKAMHCGALSPTGCEEIFLCCWTCLCALQSWLLDTGLSMNTGSLYVLSAMTPSCGVCSACRKQTSRQERKLDACFPLTPV